MEINVNQVKYDYGKLKVNAPNMMNKEGDVIYTPGRFKSAVKNGYVTGTEDIIDDNKGKSQDAINAEVDDTFALQQSLINALSNLNYVTVSTYASLPATGTVDTIYRVSNWDGSANSGAGATNAAAYSEYSWDAANNEYKLLDVKTLIGEVFDVSLYNAVGGVFATYADLSAALNAIPDAVKSPGMSIKFVLSSDNKYVQYRYMEIATTGNPNPFLDIANWQGVDDELRLGYRNLSDSTGIYKSVFVDQGNVPLNLTVGFAEDNGSWGNNANYKSVLIRVYEGKTIYFNKKDAPFNYYKYFTGEEIGSLSRITPSSGIPNNGNPWTVPQGLTYVCLIFNNTTGTFNSTFKMVGKINGNDLENGTVTNEKIGNGAVSSDKIDAIIIRSKETVVLRLSYIYYEKGNNDGIYITDCKIYTRSGFDKSINNLDGLLSALGMSDYDIAPSGANSIHVAGDKKLVIRNNNFVIDGRTTYDASDIVLLSVANSGLEGGLMAPFTKNQIGDSEVTENKLSDGLLYKFGIIDKTKTFNFQNGANYPWFYIFDYVDIKVGDVIQWSVITESTDRYYIATRNASYTTVQNTSTMSGNNSGVFIATQDAKYFALSVRQSAEYTGSYTFRAYKIVNNESQDLVSMKKYTPYGTDILTLNPEEEVLTVLKNMNHRLRDSSFVQQAKQLVLLQLTDQHADETRMNRAMLFASHYDEYINDVIHTGDIVYENWADDISWFANVENKQKILNVIGNHDVAIKAGTDGKIYTDPNDLTQYIETTGNVYLNRTDHHTLGYKNSNNEMVWVSYNDVYNRYIAPYISNWGVTQPSNAASEGLNYYYKDYTDQGIRLIVLDCMVYDTAQNTWLVNVLADAKTHRYGVIIAEHYPIQLDGFEYCAFTSSGYLDVTDFYQSEGSASRLSQAQQTVDDFMTAGGEFICWLAGHTHKDFCGVLKNYPKQVMFISDTTGINHTGWSDSIRTIGTKTEDLFTLIAVDRYKKIVRFYRVGNQWDRYARHKVSMAVDYRETKMVYSS